MGVSIIMGCDGRILYLWVDQEMYFELLDIQSNGINLEISFCHFFSTLVAVTVVLTASMWWCQMNLCFTQDSFRTYSISTLSRFSTVIILILQGSCLPFFKMILYYLSVVYTYVQVIRRATFYKQVLEVLFLQRVRVQFYSTPNNIFICISLTCDSVVL